MATAINQKIVGYSVVKIDEVKLESAPAKPTLLQRPEVLTGCTYKLKTPLSENALYVTINDLDGKPFEIFINSKAMEHFQWIVALTRVISAVFRHGGEVAFLIEELRSVFDPKGGYFNKGKYVPSLVAAIGDIVEQHLTKLGLYERDNSLQEAAVVMLAEKTKKAAQPANEDADCAYPESAILCDKCQTKAAILMDGCLTCLACGSSKCN